MVTYEVALYDEYCTTVQCNFCGGHHKYNECDGLVGLYDSECFICGSLHRDDQCYVLLDFVELPTCEFVEKYDGQYDYAEFHEEGEEELLYEQDISTDYEDEDHAQMQLLKDECKRQIGINKQLRDELHEQKERSTLLENEQDFFSTEYTNVISEIILPAIENATNSIHVIQYHLYESSIVQALCGAACEGVKVAVVVDAASVHTTDIINNKKNALTQLKASGAKVYTCAGMGSASRYGGILHHKLMVIDEERAYGGSANYSFPVKNCQNRDNISIFRKRKDILNILKIFKKCKDEGDMF